MGARQETTIRAPEPSYGNVALAHPSPTQRDKNSLPPHILSCSPLSQSRANTHFTMLKLKPAPDVQSVTRKILAQVLGKVKLNCVRSPLATLRAQKPVSGNAPLVLPYSVPAHLMQAIFDLHICF